MRSTIVEDWPRKVIMGRMLRQLRLVIGESSAYEHRRVTKKLTDGLAKIILDIGARLRIADFQT
jgi:hypothetical protein